jgi:hypothetical protein
MNIADVAKAGYNAYGANRNFTAYDGKPMPSWDDLPKGIRQAWEAAMYGALNALYEDAEPSWDNEGISPLLRDMWYERLVEANRAYFEHAVLEAAISGRTELYHYERLPAVTILWLEAQGIKVERDTESSYTLALPLAGQDEEQP